MNDKCILLVAHIDNDVHLDALDKCLNGIKQNAPNYPIILSLTGNIDYVKDRLPMVDHYITTSINTLEYLESPLNVFYSTVEWSIIYTIQPPRRYYGFAQLQKTAIGLQAAITLGYKHFLVMNYDATILDKGFVDYMFSESESVFFNFTIGGNGNRFSSDIFKLDLDGAIKLMQMCANKELYDELSRKDSGLMLEDVLGEMVLHYDIKCRKLIAHTSGIFQLYPFKILINNSYNEGAMAAVRDGVLHILITEQGHPRYTLDGKIEIGYEGNFTTFDVSKPTSILFPITKYEGNDVDIIVRTSFGESKVKLRKDVIENSTITIHN